jgi:hypothetical protein
MKLKFTKGSGKYDRLVIDRFDGSFEEISCPKQGIIPHDMMHYAVESVLQARGFLGRLKDGEVAAFAMVAEPESDSTERLVEVMQGETWSGLIPIDQLIDLYRVACAARGCPMLELNADIIADIRGRIADLSNDWQALSTGETMTLAF